ncbi:MAG: hypothetical protein KAS07_02020 [Candidatus Pacebacteria bacterium]|nr:hypothetical protein [Candidatus Paceibacterota bacterium]
MTLIERIRTEIVEPLIFLFLALAALYFVYGVFMFVKNYDSDTGRSEGKKHLVYGIIGLAIMLSVNGIIKLIQATVG